MLPLDDERRRHGDRGVGPDDDADEQHPDEVVDDLAAEEEQRHDRPQGRDARQDGSRQGLVDGMVEDLVVGLAPLLQLQLLANAVEHHDGVAHRIARQGQERRHDIERELLVQQREGPDTEEHVVEQRDDRGDAEARLEGDSARPSGRCAPGPSSLPRGGGR